jgi:methionyl aminopeptidase
VDQNRHLFLFLLSKRANILRKNNEGFIVKLQNLSSILYHLPSPVSNYSSTFQIFSEDEQEALRSGGWILQACLLHVAGFVEEGISTEELDAKAEEFIRKEGGKPAFKGYQGFTGTLCASVNDAVVHGMPNHRKLKNGDIISLDCGVIYDDLYTDACITVGVGNIVPEVQAFLDTTQQSLEDVIDEVVCAGAHVGDIGAFIQQRLQSHGYEPVPVLTGHGLGSTLHQFPDVPNLGKKGRGPVLPVGTMIAIEPIAVMGNPDVYTAADGWTVVTKDGSLACHFEHSLLITEDGCEILTA